MFWMLLPEVPGDLARESVLDTSVHPMIVHELFIEVAAWCGGDLCEMFPVYFVTTRLMKAMERRGLTGFSIREMKQRKSSEFDRVCPEEQIPLFHWLYVTGEAGVDDFGLAPIHDLIVSQRALALLQTFELSTCIIMDWPRA